MLLYDIKNPNYDLTNFESFITDIHDPIEFKQNFIKVRKPLEVGFELIPFVPYSYQNEWTLDTSPQKCGLKSRQVGFSFNELADSFHNSILYPNYTKLFTSVTQPQANELLRIVVETIQNMDPMYRIPLIAKARNILEFPNGSRLMALPTSDSAVRSFHGDIFIDEIAHVPKDRELLDAIMSVTVREGYKVSTGSTPYGQRGEYHDILKRAGWDTHSEWHDKKLVIEFLLKYKELHKKNETDWSIHLMPWWLCPDLHWERILAKTRGVLDAIRQEYGMAFLDETTAVLPYQILLDRTNYDLMQFNDRKSYKSEGRVIAGLDPAEKTNQTAFVVFELLNNIYYKRYREVWTGEEHTIYNPKILKYIKLWNIDHLYMDSTGMGAPILTELKRTIPSSRITGIKFTNPIKEDMVNNLVYLYEAEPALIWTDNDKEYRDQLHQLRKEKTRYGKNVFSGKIEGKDDDIIWATCLALIENIELLYSEFSFEVVGSEIHAKRNPYGNTRHY